MREGRLYRPTQANKWLQYYNTKNDQKKKYKI